MTIYTKKKILKWLATLLWIGYGALLLIFVRSAYSWGFYSIQYFFYAALLYVVVRLFLDPKQ